jgi:hypothetical protein
VTLLHDPDLGTPAKPGESSVNVVVDGVEVTVPAGTSVMRAAALAGVDVPSGTATATPSISTSTVGSPGIAGVPRSGATCPVGS